MLHIMAHRKSQPMCLTWLVIGILTDHHDPYTIGWSGFKGSEYFLFSWIGGLKAHGILPKVLNPKFRLCRKAIFQHPLPCFRYVLQPLHARKIYTLLTQNGIHEKLSIHNCKG